MLPNDLLSLLMLYQELSPRLEADSIVHEGEEGIDGVRATRANLSEEFLLHINLHLALLLNLLHSQVEELVLSDKLSDLHILV